MGSLERYFPVIKTDSSLKQKDTKKSAPRYSPYQTPTTTARDVKRPSDAELGKFLLSTLKDKHNPITHSTSRLRAEHVESTATGHQRRESVMNRTLYLKHRREKLKNQEERPEPPTSSSANSSGKMQLSSPVSSTSASSATASSSSTLNADEPPKTKKLVMTGVRVYINGYLRDTTDIEMKRTVTLAGGQVLLTPSNATHVLTSQGLNGSKTHKHLTKNSRNKVHIVKPEWVVDSINVGKRLPERHYTIVTNHTMDSVAKMFGERPYERPFPPSP